MRYASTRWQQARQASFSNVIGMELRQLARPVQVAFSIVMKENAGDPSGVEYRHNSKSVWAFVLPDVSEPGFRIQFFDIRGVLGHQHCDSLEQAVEEMVFQGYTVKDVGAFDRASSTQVWSAHIPQLDQIQNCLWAEGNA